MKKMMRSFAITSLMIVYLILPLISTAGTVEDADAAKAADEHGDYTTALRIWRRLAESGNPNAQAIIGMRYEDGKGVSQSFAEAAKWYRRAAEQGLSEAQLLLGILYATGKGVPQDPEQSAKWYRQAAEQDEAAAQARLGSQYISGKGVPKSIKEGLYWYRRAADQGDARAQWLLGGLYANGEGVNQDYVTAYMWLNLAAAKVTFNGEKSVIAEAITKSRDIVAARMTKEQIAEAQKLAREWKPVSKH